MIYLVVQIDNFYLMKKTELTEALERIEKEKEDPDFYLTYTDDKIEMIQQAIE